MADKAESDWGNKIMQATRVAPTIWPLVFAAVVGNTLKAIAHQRAEKGTRLGVSSAIKQNTLEVAKRQILTLQH